MNVDVAITIAAPALKVWEVTTNIERAAETISAIESVEILERPLEGLIGLKWRETRVMFGKRETETMWVTAAQALSYYEVEARNHGTRYLSRFDVEPLSEQSTRLRMTFTAQAQTFSAKALSSLGFLFSAATRKALMRDLEDIKAACEAAD